MSIRKLREVLSIIESEAKANPVFAEKLSRVLGGEAHPRSRSRRAPAILDPVSVYQAEGDLGLRKKLSVLAIDQLRDIVSEYGMDKSQLVMKWTKPERVIEHIVQTAATRARKGDAFR